MSRWEMGDLHKFPLLLAKLEKICLRRPLADWIGKNILQEHQQHWHWFSWDPKMVPTQQGDCFTLPLPLDATFSSITYPRSNPPISFQWKRLPKTKNYCLDCILCAQIELPNLQYFFHFHCGETLANLPSFWIPNCCSQWCDVRWLSERMSRGGCGQS